MNPVDKYLKLTEGKELSSPINNISVLTEASNWNTKKYLGYYKDKTDFPFLILMKGKEGASYLSLDKIINIGRKVFNDYWKNKGVLEKIRKDFEKQKEILKKGYEKLNFDYIKHINEDALINELKKAGNAGWFANAIGLFASQIDKEFCLNELKRIGIKINFNKLDKNWNKIIEPVYPSFNKKMYLYYLELLKSKERWKDIVEKCQYFYTGYGAPVSLRVVGKELILGYGKPSFSKAEDILKSEIKKQKLKEKQYNDFISKLGRNEKKFAKYIQGLINIRDDRKELTSKLSTLVFRVALKIGGNAELNIKEILYCSYNELIKGNKYLIKIKQELKERAKGFAVLVNYDGKIEQEKVNFDLLSKKIDSTYLKKVGISKKVNKLTGQIGNIGKVTGFVKVVLNLSCDANKFKLGDILVTGQTRPDFIPLIRKAGAIITEEGGLTCHATIVSREMKKPCIIGTKIATKVLKDGDLIEVDANKGIVKIIKRAK